MIAIIFIITVLLAVNIMQLTLLYKLVFQVDSIQEDMLHIRGRVEHISRSIDE